MKYYLYLIDENGVDKAYRDISNVFTRFKPSEDKKINNLFLNKWLQDRASSYKKKYFAKNKGYLMIRLIANNGCLIGSSYWYNENGNIVY